MPMQSPMRPFGRSFSTRRDVIRAGNIRYGREDLETPETLVSHYLANGTLGGCFDPLGAMSLGAEEDALPIIGSTYFCYMSHFTHGQFGMDYALPTGRLTLQVEGTGTGRSALESLREYNQELDLSEAILSTRFSRTHPEGGLIRIHRRQFFSRTRPHLFVQRHDINSEQETRTVIAFHPVRETPYHYGGLFQCEAPCYQAGREIWWPIETNRVTTFAVLYVDGGEEPEPTPDGLSIKTRGDQTLLLWLSLLSTADEEVGLEAARSIVSIAQQEGWETVLNEHQESWRQFWNESLIQFPSGAEEQQKVWLRSNYYLGSTLSSSVSRPPLVTGLARVAWPSYFPQDFLFLYQNTLSANHLSLARSTSHFWHDILTEAQWYAKRMFSLPGVYYPWTPPIQDWSDYHVQGVPNTCYYEHHNSAYVARLCWDHYAFTGDMEYLRSHAWPVIKGIAEMYEGMLADVGSSRRLQIHFTPSKSQDEYAPENQINYFDLLLSAEYSLRIALETATLLSKDREACQRWTDLLARGFDYQRLEKDNIHAVFENDDRPLGGQKHPVQLNPIALLTVNHLFRNPRVLNAYQKRYSIASGYEEGRATAWTLGEFLLASVRLRSAEGFCKDWSMFHHCRLADPRFIQVREGTGNDKTHFMTTQGFLMESLTETALQSWLGSVNVFPLMLPEWRDGSKQKPFLFEGLRAPGGFLFGGTCEGKVQEISVNSTIGGLLSIKVPIAWDGAVFLEFPDRRLATGMGGQTLKVRTLPGRRYQLRPFRAGR